MSLQLILRVLAHEDRSRDKLAHIGAHNRRTVVRHQDSWMFCKRTRKRAALLRFDHQQIGVSEFVPLVPEWNVLAGCRSEMKHRNDRHAGDAERQHRWGMMMTNRDDVG